MRLVAISGSLRRQSINTCALRAASELAPAGVEVVFVSFADLPPFNPDDDTDAPPPAVVRLREEILHCDGVIIASPEYAHGVPGVLKNGLDWLVGSSEFVGKPVALLGTSQRAQFAPAALAEILR